MKFGAFAMFSNPHPEFRPTDQLYGDLLDLCEQAEDLGFDRVWTGEHHFFDGVLPSSLPVLAAVAARTRRTKEPGW